MEQEFKNLKPLQPHMGRRSLRNDYNTPGIYHITVKVAEQLGQPLGQVVGNPEAAADSPEAPHVALTPVGRMVEQELLHSVSHYYPMVEVQDYVVMPEHLHFIVQVHACIKSPNGKDMPLGQVIAGFKNGCNKRFWEMTGQKAAASSPAASSPAASSAPAATPAASSPASSAPVASSPAEEPQGANSGSSAVKASRGPKPRFSSGRQPLFAPGYVDVMPLRPGQLETQRAYIKENPRSRLLRSLNRSWLATQRGDIATALFPKALRGFLVRECPATAATPAILDTLQAQLLMADDGTITCDSYGDRQLLAQRLLPVVCHRRDAWRFQQQKACCLQAAQKGAVLVSARIAKGEQEIMDTALSQGFPIILISDNGFPDRYHPSTERIAHCLAHRLLLLTPWQYHYQYADSAITVAVCKTMNCVVQSLCRLKDTWWQE